MDKEKRLLKVVKMPKVAPLLDDAEGDWCKNPSLYTEEFAPLETRVERKHPALAQGLVKLKQLLGEENYTRYIESLPNIVKKEKKLLIVADSFMQRSLIERDFIPQFKEAFSVSNVQVIG